VYTSCYRKVVITMRSSVKYDPQRVGPVVQKMSPIDREEVLFHQSRFTPLPKGISDAVKAAEKGVKIDH
jgi:hypothetical protein